MWYGPHGRCDVQYKATAAPATVSGERLPDATDRQSARDGSGRRQGAMTREPGDLPSIEVACRAGCLGDGRVRLGCAWISVG